MRSATSIATPRFCSISSTAISLSAARSRSACDHLLDDHRRQAFGRLVHHQQLRLEQQRPADRQHLLLAARELRAAVAACARPGAGTSRRCDRPRAAAAPPGAGSRRPTERRPDAPALRHVGDAAPGDSVRRQAAGSARPHRRMLPLRRHQPGDRVAQRRLAHAVAADDAEHAALERRSSRPAAHGRGRSRRRGPRPPAPAPRGAAALSLGARTRPSVSCSPCRSPAPAASFSISSGVPVFSTRPLCITVTRSTTRSAISRSCSISTKLMCAGSEASSATSSRRSAGDRPAAGSSNRIRRGAPASAMPISSWRCWPCARSATRVVGDVRQARALEQVVGGARSRHGRGRRARKLKRPLATPRTARKRLSRTVRSRNSSEDW